MSENCWTYLITNYCSYLFFDFWYSQVDKSWFICYCERHHSIFFFPIWSDLPGRHKKYTLFTTAQTAPSARDKHYKAYKSLVNVVVSTKSKSTCWHFSVQLRKCSNFHEESNSQVKLSKKTLHKPYKKCKEKGSLLHSMLWHTLMIQTATGSMLRHSQGKSRLHSKISESKPPLKRSSLHFSRVPLLLYLV